MINHPNRNKTLSIKGFNTDLTCRGFQFEAGKTYTVSGEIKACKNGFHACPIDQHPLSVLEFYAPATSRYFEVSQGGKRDPQGTKLASATITINAEISLGELTQQAVKWVFDRANWKNAASVTEKNEGATVSGVRGAATASGDSGAATASGYGGRVRGAKGCAMFLVERNADYEVVAVWAGIAGKNGIKPNTFYRLVNGKPVEVEQ